MLRVLACSLLISLGFAVQAAEDRYPGYGVVESITPLKPVPSKEESASAGGSAPRKPAYRIRVRMDDGRIQTRIVQSLEVSKGERVLLTNAGDVVPE